MKNEKNYHQKANYRKAFIIINNTQ